MLTAFSPAWSGRKTPCVRRWLGLGRRAIQRPAGEKKNPVWNRRNPLKSLNSDERIQENPNKTRTFFLGFIWFPWIFLAGRCPPALRPAAALGFARDNSLPPSS